MRPTGIFMHEADETIIFFMASKMSPRRMYEDPLF